MTTAFFIGTLVVIAYAGYLAGVATRTMINKNKDKSE